MENLFKCTLVTATLFLCMTGPCLAYSVLTHEAIIDANWDKVLLPLLRQKYPSSTNDELKEAHAYAYGGAVTPDMGYLPFGSKLFTNLIHYVRSGDFIQAVLKDAQDLNEYAFALGILCHYQADKYGHSIGINPSVPYVYPKMRRKFGDTVTYFQDHISHVRVEFSFDVLQTARGNYATAAYHDFVGFKIARRVLESAFLKTYGLNVNDLFHNHLSRTIGTFRWIVKDLFPVITRAAWATQKSEIKKIRPTLTSRKFVYRMHRKDYYREFNNKDERPPFFGNLLSLLIRIAPKIGPLRVLKFKTPGAGAEKLFIKSFDSVVVNYSNCITELQRGDIVLANIDFDTGKKTAQEEYGLADESYGDLLLKLQEKNYTTTSSSLQQNILSFYSSSTVTEETAKKRSAREKREWKKTMDALEGLKKVTTQ
jgi:Zinc dependent phospholipase C